MAEMTRGDRKDLATLARKRAKVAKAAIASRAAELKADLEEQLATMYEFDDDAVWKELHDEAAAAVTAAIRRAQRRMGRRCDELGIPLWARPAIVGGVQWSERGENALAERRAELRRVADTKIEATAQASTTCLSATPSTACSTAQTAAVAIVAARPHLAITLEAPRSWRAR